jgi:hypothetical protein
LARNAQGCVARHEPYVFNPSMFGRPIYDYTVGDRRNTRQLLARKAWIVARRGAPTYVETSHAFLKSYFDLAPEYFDNLKVIHLLRNPLMVARSEANREEFAHWLRFPLRHYRGAGGRKYFRWSLTGNEPIFKHFDPAKLTRFQWYVIQWIEIENRAMEFLDRTGKLDECFTLETPGDMNNRARIRELLDFYGLAQRQPEITLAGSRNLNPRPTVVGDEDRRQFAEVVAALPPKYLGIFQREPYTRFRWASLLTSIVPAPGQPSRESIAPSR